MSARDTRGGIVSALLLLVVGLVAGLLLAEGLVRVVAPQLTYRFPRGLFVADDATGYRLRPGFRGVLDTPEYRTPIGINAQGLRAERVYGSKPPGVTRILVLGDSFAMGVGVTEEETVAARLERLLDADGRFEVVNAGVPGYSTEQEVAWLQAYGLALEPDAIVVMFFVGNDVADNSRLPLRERDGYLVNATQAPAGLLPVSLRTQLSLHSQLYHFVWPRWRRLAGRPEQFDGADLARSMRAAGEGDVASPGWDRTAAALDRLAQLAGAHRLPTAVVLIPDLVQCSSEAWAAFVARAGGDAALQAPTEPNARVAGLARARGLAVFDLLPVFGAATTPLYFDMDHHLTPVGTELAARTLHPFVRDLVGTEGRVVAGR